MFKIANIAVACSVAVLTFAPAAQAAGITNGDFGTGTLAGWLATGNSAVDSTSNFGPPAGGLSAQAVMGTASAAGFLFGGSVVGAAALDTFTGLAAGTLAAMGGVVGSGIGQSFTSVAGDTLSFSWKFMSDEPVNSPANDTAFMVLDGVYTMLSSVQTALFTGSSPSPMLDETAYKTFSMTLGAGSHKLAFGIIDVPDSLGASALAISGVALIAGSVPEPQTWALMLAGAAAVASTVRRRTATL